MVKKDYKQSETKTPLCKCGCSQPTKWNKKLKRFNIYLNGHHSRGKNNPMYGIPSPNTGKHPSKVTRDKIGKANSGENHYLFGKHHTEKWKKDMSKTLKGRIFTEEHRKNLSKAGSGENHHMWGKHPTQKTRDKMSKAHSGENNSFFGKHHTESTRKKIGDGNRGKIRSEITRKKLSKANKGLLAGEKNPNYGKHPSKETIKKLSESLKGNTNMLGKHHSPKTIEGIRKRMTGKNNPMYGVHLIGDKNGNWLGGKSFEPYTPDFNGQFKRAIRERDNHCCVVCNKPQEELKRCLSVHHIDYNKLNSFPQNCVSLCRGCHLQTNKNRKAWIVFFQKLLKEKYGYQYTQDQKIILDFDKIS